MLRLVNQSFSPKIFGFYLIKKVMITFVKSVTTLSGLP